jgi:O-antigen ligase
MVALAVCLLPFLDPPGAGNTAPMDVGITAAVALGLLWMARESLPLPMPYAWGVLIMLTAGALAAVVAGAPAITALVLAQDLLLLFWASVLALGARQPALIAAATRAWGISAPLYASVMVVAYLTGLNAVAGVSPDNGVRASYTFGDPNLAGNYLVASIFVMAACERPRRPILRRLGYLVMLTAIVFTGSNGAYLTFFLGMVVALCITVFRRSGALAGTATLFAVLASAVLVLGFVLPAINMDAVRHEAADSVPLLRDSIARSGDSSSERSMILHEGYAEWLDGDLLGHGPGQTMESLTERQAPYPKEAHNDYLAVLLERGVVGFVGLLVLLYAVGARCARLLTGELPEAFRASVPRWWLLVAIGPVMAVAGTFYEVLHFRHLWTWLGLVAALSAVAVVRRRDVGLGADDGGDGPRGVGVDRGAGLFHGDSR